MYPVAIKKLHTKATPVSFMNEVTSIELRLIDIDWELLTRLPQGSLEAWNLSYDWCYADCSLLAGRGLAQMPQFSCPGNAGGICFAGMLL